MANTPPPREQLLTRYHIFTTDEHAIVLNRIGQQDATGSDAALRKFFSEPLRDNDGFYIAISENSLKLRKAVAQVKTTLSNLDLPPVPAPEAEQKLDV